MTLLVSSLPSGWRIMPLSEVVKENAPILYGILQPGPDLADGVPYVRPTEINGDEIDLPSLRRTTPAIASKYRRSVLEAGDVILSIVGTIGKVAVVPPVLTGGNITQSSVRIRPNPDIANSDFVAWALRSPVLIKQYDAARLGTAVPRLNVAHVRDLQIPIPTACAQGSIVAEIERQFTRLDAGVAGLERVRANLKRYRAAVLKAACEGTLVPTEAALARAEGRDYETGEQLLERMLTTRRENWTSKGKYKTPASPDTTGLPPLPEGWTWATPDQVCEVVASGSTPSADKMARGEGEIPFVKVYNLTFGSPVDFSVKPTFIPRLIHDGPLARSKVIPGDVLMNIVGPPLGKVSVVPTDFPEWNINQAVVVFRPTTATSSRYLAATFRSPPFLRRLEATAKATAGQFNVQVTTCRGISIPLPPLAEQHRIVAEVERRLSVIDELETLVESNLARAGRLRQSILARAFSGELVPEEAC